MVDIVKKTAQNRVSENKDNPKTKSSTTKPGKARRRTKGWEYMLADAVFGLYEASLYILTLAAPVYMFLMARDKHAIFLILSIMLGRMLAGFIFVTLLILTKRLLIGEVKQGRYFLTSRKALKWIFADQLSKILARSPFGEMVNEGSLSRQYYYRGMGAKIDSTFFTGRGVNITEPYLLETGKNVILGNGAAISGHKVERNVVTLARVEIGNDVLIGARAIIFPGVKIGDGAAVGANSVVTRGTVIKDGETWAGNPAKRVDLFEGIKKEKPEPARKSQ